MKIHIGEAVIQHHSEILKLAKESKYTKDFGHMMFSGKEMYDKGWISIALKDDDDDIVGFSCVRHKVRQPATSIYFIGVSNKVRNKGIGTKLLKQIERTTPHKVLELNCEKDNDEALSFYRKHGFDAIEESLKGKGYKLRKVLK